jgi:hypothetical protein
MVTSPNYMVSVYLYATRYTHHMNIKIGDKKISELTPTNLIDIAIIEVPNLSTGEDTQY